MYVDQHIEPAEAGIDKLEKCANLFMTLNIGNFALDFTAGFFRQFLNRKVDGFLAAATNCHLCALRQQHLGDGPADAARPSGD